MDRQKFLEEIEATFFRAMMAGYAVEKVEKVKVIDMPGFKRITYTDDDWLVIDQWAVNPDTNFSAGATNIWHQGKLVWVMNYGGFYPESVVQFLKAALRSQYELSEFLGGRGPVNYREGNLGYSNMWSGDFSRFHGIERIFIYRLLNGHLEHGYHNYWGMSLI